MSLDRKTDTLPRVLGPVEAFCVIVGCVIGSGIFIVPAKVAREAPFMGLIIVLWIVGGLFCGAGALTLAELGAMLPRAGGPYVYLRAAYGALPAFLFGWAEFLVVRTGSMATLAAAFARYFAQVVPPPTGIRSEVWQAGSAGLAIAVVAIVNVLGTAFGGRLQVGGTVLKVGGVCTLIALPFVIGGGDVSHFSPVWPRGVTTSMLGGMMAAMVGILWAYDGWINLTPLAEEVRDPGRNLPRAMILGMGTLIALYLGMTLVYHYVLPFSEVAGSSDKGGTRAVAAVFCNHLLGRRGLLAISVLVMCSTFISLNGNALTGPRSYFAMARDGLFFHSLARIHPRFETPANAVIAQAVWAISLTVAGTAMIVSPAPTAASGLPAPVLAAWVKLNTTPLYDLLYTYVIFGANLFYLLAIASVFVLRVRQPDLPRPYRTWGYPVTPALYLVASLCLLGDMLVRTPAESISGLAIVALGLPAYWAFRRTAAEPAVVS
jgi:amino acid transporter